MAVGAVFGLGQSLALPRGIRRLPWIAANEAGWAVGLPAIYVAAQIAGGLQGWTDRIVVWAAGGFLAGASIGITTGVALVFHARARARRDG